MKQIRVLHVITGMGSGGAESLIMNIFRNIDRDKIMFDFLLRSNENIYKEEIENLGGKIYTTSTYPKHILKNYKETKTFFNTHKEYDIVHVHGNAFIYITPLILATKNNLKCRIMHSHNTNTRKPYYRIIHEFNKLFIDKLCTNYLACSNEAGKWMFNSRKFKIIKNGVEVDKFIFNTEYRKKIRKEFKISEKTTVIGHIGRFTDCKNHNYIVDIFKEYLNINEDSKLILVGEGPLLEEIKMKVDRIGIKNKVIFTGVRKDVNEILSAIDCFLFPSKFEGLALAMVEAQSAGVPCIISNTITKEIDLTDLIERKSIDISPKEWAISLNNKLEKCTERRNMLKQITLSGYNVNISAENIEEFYLSQINK